VSQCLASGRVILDAFGIQCLLSQSQVSVYMFACQLWRPLTDTHQHRWTNLSGAFGHWVVRFGRGRGYAHRCCRPLNAAQWVVSSDCTTSDCQNVVKYNITGAGSLSLSNNEFHLQYLIGSVTGIIGTDTVTLGSYDISSQVQIQPVQL